MIGEQIKKTGVIFCGFVLSDQTCQETAFIDYLSDSSTNLLFCTLYNARWFFTQSALGRIEILFEFVNQFLTLG